jgi:hypothetical protein
VGSLLEGIDTSAPVGKSKNAATGGGGSEAAKTVKLVLAIVGLLIGGALIAWNMGVFGSSDAPRPTAGLTPEQPAQPAQPGPANNNRNTSAPVTKPIGDMPLR